MPPHETRPLWAESPNPRMYKRPRPNDFDEDSWAQVDGGRIPSDAGYLEMERDNEVEDSYGDVEMYGP